MIKGENEYEYYKWRYSQVNVNQCFLLWSPFPFVYASVGWGEFIRTDERVHGGKLERSPIVHERINKK